MARHTSSNPHRGVAMLLVLAVLVVGLSAATIASQVAVTRALTQRQASAEHSVFQMSRALETWLPYWLDEHSGEVVLPADAAIAGLVIFEDQLPSTDQTRGTAGTVTVTAWDLRGMLPSWAVGTSQLRSAAGMLPGEWLVMVRKLDEDEPGLDELAALVPLVYPRVEHAVNAEQSAGIVNAQAATGSSVNVLPLGGLVAPLARPQEEGASGAQPTIPLNINTFPLELLDAIVQSEGVDLGERIKDNRAAGTQSSAGALRLGDRRSALSLIDRSDAWAFRIDVHDNRISRSFWFTYQRADQNWELTQRHVIR